MGDYNCIIIIIIIIIVYSSKGSVCCVVCLVWINDQRRKNILFVVSLVWVATRG